MRDELKPSLYGEEMLEGYAKTFPEQVHLFVAMAVFIGNTLNILHRTRKIYQPVDTRYSGI